MVSGFLLSTFMIGLIAMNKLYVGNLSYSTTSAKLTEVFGAYGKVVEVVLPTDRQTGRPRGFGFVTYADAASAKSALALNNTEVDGRNIRVNIAEDRRDDRGGDRGGRDDRGGDRGGRGGRGDDRGDSRY
jgi:RNA recognition motif-containing protein